MKKFLTCLSLAFASLTLHALAGTIDFAAPGMDDEAVLSRSMSQLAAAVLPEYREENRERYLNTLFRLQMLTGKHEEAIATIKALRDSSQAADPARASTLFAQYEIYSDARRKVIGGGILFASAFGDAFREAFAKYDDLTAARVQESMAFSLERAHRDIAQALLPLSGKRGIEIDQAIALLRLYQPYRAYQDMLPLAPALIAADDRRRYDIRDDVLIKTPEGATLSALVVRPKRMSDPQPAALFVNIYTDVADNLAEAKRSAAHGYVGVVADPRGKRLSPDAIAPYEHEARDVRAVIDWVSRQSWCDGRVGMYGGSYSGFAAWAATKYPHPALKTIVPYVAVIPGLGLPMENNVFLNSNYGWAFYVTNNKFRDDKVYNDPDRWQSLARNWYESGRPYREIDRVDGTPNPFLQRWLAHPAYDRFWQSMVPYKRDFARIDIPVLSVTGYYDDGQISALHYLREHYRYNPRADHYLIIGPYDHFGAQSRPSPVISGYAIDPIANIDVTAITYQWFDHIFRGGAKPALLKDKINYEVMGANEWRHAPSLEKATDERRRFYLSPMASGNYHRLAAEKAKNPGFLEQTVDLADRKSINNDYYPSPVIRKEIDLAGGLAFISEPFDSPATFAGMMSGVLKATINKKDMDIGVVLYEVTPAGEYFHLSYFLGRASYANDMSHRKLLVPGRVESIAFDRSRMSSRRISKGSRLLVVLNVNKNMWAQVNHGTGRDVSTESVADAKVPLKIKWHGDSYVDIPLSQK